MKKVSIFSLWVLLLASSVMGSAQTNNVIHSPFTSATGAVDPALVAVAQHSEDIASQGEVSLKQERYLAAEASFRAALEMARSSATGINPDATRGLAEALVGEGKTAEAEQTYRTLIYQEPYKWSSNAQETRTTMGFAILLSQISKWPEAVSVYKAALGSAASEDARKLDVNFDPRTPMPLLLQAMAHTAVGLDYSGYADSAAAFAEYSKGVRLQPNNPLVNYYYGYGWQRLTPADQVKFGTAQRAKAALQKAVKSDDASIKAAAQKALLVAMQH